MSTTIQHKDALGQPINPGDYVWAASNSSGSRVRLVVKLTESRVMVDNRSPKEGCDLIVVNAILDSTNDTTIRANLTAKYGSKIDYNVALKPASELPLRFLVVGWGADISKSVQPDCFTIVEVRGTSNDVAQKAGTDASNNYGGGDTYVHKIMRMVKKPQVRWDRTVREYVPKTHWEDGYYTDAGNLLTLKDLKDRGLAGFDTGTVISMAQYVDGMDPHNMNHPASLFN